MKLDRVQIKNFRSIKELTFDFTPSFKILVGKNESGKSNIIRALSFLSPPIKPTIEDKREFLPNEKFENDYHVFFIFKLNDLEIKNIFNSLKKEILLNNTSKIICFLSTKYTLIEFCKNRNEGIYRINLDSGVKDYAYWSLNNYYKFLPNIKRYKNYIKRKEGEALTVYNSFIVNVDEHKDINKGDFVDISIDEISVLIGTKIIEYVKLNHPETIYWQYDEKNLLPNNININSFITDQNVCIPLKILFNLAGITDIKTAISQAMKAKGNQFDNLLKRVSDQATNHFKEVWKEYPDISFAFTHNGDNIISAIQEENKYPLAQRSDGFKRFVTFLILISVCAKNEELENTLILFDEPDISLHPSGIKYLRDELKRVSINNFIVASTHSIFMIDNDFIERHLIVTKEKEITNLKTAHGTDLFEEEVIFKAIGYSMYEIMKQKNIIFEGWRDKKLFNTALENNSFKKKSFCKKLTTYGCCQSNGVKGVKTLTPIFESVNRKCIIITDADEPANQRKAEYGKLHGIGKWKTYLEIDDSCLAKTGEDFLKLDYIKSNIKKIKDLYLELINEPDFIANSKGVISNVDKWLSTQKNKEETKQIINEFKSLLFENLEVKNIDLKYYAFLQKLQKEVEVI
ncbi:MAG: AAA family ATPase [Candidatus Nanoarchaeia archaeon]|nr:AAA family ATPase [Candidatus Nanoarchaeia archaeon]